MWKIINQNLSYFAEEIRFYKPKGSKSKSQRIYLNPLKIYNIIYQMFKRKIIQKNFKARERLRQQKGLQREFTTYVMDQSYEEPQTLPDFSQSSSTFFQDDWYIILEESVWEPTQNMNLFCAYQDQEKKIEKLEPKETNNQLERLNAEFFAKMALEQVNQTSITKKIRFQTFLRAKDFPEDSTPMEIHKLCESLQHVRFQN